MEINDDQIAEAFDGYNFGDMGLTAESRRKGVARAVLKLVSGYSNGRSMTNILQYLKLTYRHGGKPTKDAVQWMYHEYHPFGGD